MKHKQISEFIDDLTEFIINYHDFRIESTRLNKILKKAHKLPKDDIDNARESLKTLIEDTDDNVVEWIETFQNNGAGAKNMNKRFELMDTI